MINSYLKGAKSGLNAFEEIVEVLTDGSTVEAAKVCIM